MAQQVVQSAAKRGGTLNGTHRFTLRVALAAGATVATLVSAQIFASFDRPAVATNSNSAPNLSSGTTSQSATAALPAINAVALAAAPPHLVIIRGTGSSNVNSAPGQSDAIVPPAAVAIQMPVAAAAAQPVQQGGGGGSAPPQAAPPQPKPPTKSS